MGYCLCVRLSCSGTLRRWWASHCSHAPCIYKSIAYTHIMYVLRPSIDLFEPRAPGGETKNTTKIVTPPKHKRAAKFKIHLEDDKSSVYTFCCFCAFSCSRSRATPVVFSCLQQYFSENLLSPSVRPSGFRQISRHYSPSRC